MRQYTRLDLIRFARLSKENQDLKPMELLKLYDEKYPELSNKQKLINLAKGMRINGLYKALTKEELPNEPEMSCALCGYFCNNAHHANNWFELDTVGNEILKQELNHNFKHQGK